MGIIIADDHALFREGLCRIIKSIDRNVTIHEASDAKELFSLLESDESFRIVLVDLGMPGMEGMSSILQIKQKAGCPVAAVSGLDDTRMIREMLRLGLDGFIPKSVKSEILLGAIKLILSGGRYIPQDLLKEKRAESPADDLPHITRRQLEVLQWVVRGFPNREIATELQLSEYTVRIHVAALLKHFEARNRTHLVAMAREKGIITD